jgi:phosphoribosylglycinamide formyltransferase-1
MKNIAVFASGNGTNAEAIISFFENDKETKVSLILSNKADAYVLKRAENHNIPAKVFTRQELENGTVLRQLMESDIDLVVLAGFLLLIPNEIVAAYPHRIINIHPALLPNYGGKGMYGDHVHLAVIENGEVESGITIHYVNENYDEGDIIFQARCAVEAGDTPETLATKIHALEYRHYPSIIAKVARKL